MRRRQKILRLAPLAAFVALGAAPATAGAPALVPEPASLRTAAADSTLPPPAPTSSEQPPRERRTHTIVLSDERTLSRWAFVYRSVTARREPSGHAARMKRLRTVTGDGTPELALVLRKLVKRNGAVWLKIRLPMRPNNRTGWVPRRAMGPLHTVRTFLLVQRYRFRATLFRRGKRIWTARLGVGKRGTATPSGNFYVRERLIPAKGDTIYGVFAFGTSAYSATLTDWPGGGVVGIHGTNQPELIPGRISHGCIRVRNGPMRRLRRLMPLGTPIKIE